MVNHGTVQHNQHAELLGGGQQAAARQWRRQWHPNRRLEKAEKPLRTFQMILKN